MKNQMIDLLNEKFTYAPEKLHLSVDQIEQSVPEGKHYRGTFAVGLASGKQIQGYLYSTNERVRFSPEYFIGRRETVAYEMDTSGLRAGERIQGAFVICVAGGEYTLPYSLQITGNPAEEQKVRKMSPEAFTALAKEDFAGAYGLFASEQFREIIKDWDPMAAALYEGIAGQPFRFYSLEQFLVGMGQKEPVTLSAQNNYVYLNAPGQNEREEILLTKHTWGFAHIQISCDAPFLTIERPEVTTEEFVGSTYSLGFVVNTEKLHKGRNFARIRIRTQCREQICAVEIRNAPALSAKKKERRVRQEIVRLSDAYTDYRCRRTQTGEWAGISLNCLDNIRREGCEHIFFELYRAYILFLSGDSIEAQVCLSELTRRREELVIPQWKGCYLYLTTFSNPDKSYVDYVKEEIRDLFLANRENWLLQWLMLYLCADTFRNDSERLDAIRRQYICGCKNPVLYLEAWEILKREPLMLRAMEPFEIHLLGFLCKERLLDNEICGQAAQLAARVPAYHALLYKTLAGCYEQFPSRNLLAAICSLLMKGHKNGPQYAKWFELGVKQDIRLAGLYEYYAQTAQDLNVRELPQAVRMYFSYNNTLGYLKKAAIYANVVRARTKDPQTFEAYRSTMERFMEEQLLEGRINEDLALLYEALLTRFVMDERLAPGLSKVLFSYEVSCQNPEIHHVIVVHSQLRREQRVQFFDGKAYVQKYGPNSCILLEDADGVRYADTSLYTVKRLLTRTAFEDYCRSRSAVPEELLLSDLAKETEVTRENAARFVQLMSLERLRDDYREAIQEKLLVYFSGHPYADGLREYLEKAKYEPLLPRYIAELTELLVSEGMTRKAYQIVRGYGAEHVETNTLVRLCSRCVSQEGGQEDGYLLALCARCFLRGKYDEAPVETMKALWDAGRRFELEDFVLEEKILATVLYTQSGMEGTEEIFDSYRKKQGNEKLCRAYLIFMAYCYFVKEIKLAPPLPEQIEKMALKKTDAPRVCQLALLRYYAYEDRLNEEQEKYLYALLNKFTAQGLYFRFYQRLPAKLLRYFHLHDKYILEYRTDPASHVTLHYRLNEDKEQAIPMKHVYEGIFIREFTLFYHDRLEWYLEVENGDHTERTARQTILCGRRAHRGNTGRFELINRLAEAQQRGDREQQAAIRDQYVGQQYLVETLFTIQ